MTDVRVLDNDVDLDGNLDVLSLAVTASPGSGVPMVEEVPGHELVVRYRAPAAGGREGFSYRVCDALGACDDAEVTVLLAPGACTIRGTAGDDVLVGTAGDDVICGFGGDDTLWGGPGDDRLHGGPGADTCTSGPHTAACET
ncbi:MAG: hypothetical protein OXF11_10020 [Deltaproteobacteria bacterium]|nr:hypothetical protein [Deltaproteobacteria bacterium]